MPFGWAPWPRIATIGPWFVGSLPGVVVSNAAPAFGTERRPGSESLPRQDVASVAKKSMNVVGSIEHVREPGRSGRAG